MSKDLVEVLKACTGYRVGPSDMHCRGKRYLYQLMLFIKAGNTISRGCKVILLIKDGFTYETLHQCYRCWWRKWVVTMLFYVVTTNALLHILRASSYSVHWLEAPWLHEVSCEIHVHRCIMISVNSCIQSSRSVLCASLKAAFSILLWKCTCFQLLWTKCRRTQ